MAQQTLPIFNKKATEKLRSPDDLEAYIRVTNPSAWAVLAACVTLLVGLFAWGIFGTVSTSVTGMGVVIDGQACCFLSADEVTRLHQGDTALVGGTKMTVAQIARLPLSRAEASEILQSDYLVETLVEGNWATQVTFEGDVATLNEGVPITVNITTERVSPLKLVLGA